MKAVTIEQKLYCSSVNCAVDLALRTFSSVHVPFVISELPARLLYVPCSSGCIEQNVSLFTYNLKKNLLKYIFGSLG